MLRKHGEKIMRRRAKRQYRTTWDDGGRAHLRLRVERVSKKQPVNAEAKFFAASTAFLVAFALSMMSAYGISAEKPAQPERIMISQSAPITP